MQVKQQPAIAPSSDPAKDTHSKGFLDFLNDAPTVFHAVAHYTTKLNNAGYTHLAERDDWQAIIKPGGKYYLTRNGSSLVAFAVGRKYSPGKGVALIGSHIDALTMRVKPVSKKSSLGYLQLGVSPYAGGGNMTWWDRDLGLAGRVLVTDKATGAIKQHLVRLPYPVAKIPTLAPHFGAPSQPPFNPETNMTPIIGLEEQSALQSLEAQFNALSSNAPINNPTSNHAPRLLAAVAKQLNIQVTQIADLELELFDFQPAQPFGLDAELLSVPRCDDKLCSYAAAEALLNATQDARFLAESGCISMVYLADDEEIGSGLRQGAAGNTIPITVERIVDVLNTDKRPLQNLVAMTFARSFFISADDIHAVNPNFAGAYELNMAPRLNVGPVISCDPNGHMTTDAPSKAIAQQIALKTGVPLQLFQIRNDSRSGGTIGPMLSKQTGMRAIDIGIPQLAMHSIRATTGSKDPGLGVKYFEGFFRHFEHVEGTVTVD
ncbi:aminopeptidase I [Protomyces lactucae-debilis]|uniref:Aminopeptidase I n=1 Tax=Protomyces lactucae-debilis TaxID=2754530 RepID=A0A1Y2FJ32_PROLT|nr:aminopeptidase I [Protomyces lactucae-debilis]ORY83266.1 aminopeptidase I [Protomyces lactucae-debilis]